MISNISIDRVATYNTPNHLDDLRKINFIFGANGTGKTTISRIIDQAEAHPHCAVQWQGGNQLEAMVYNRDFIDRNFNQENTVKGVFTLGDNQVEAEREIASLRPDLEKVVREIDSLTIQLDGEDGTPGKRKELQNIELSLRDKCWRQKQKHDGYFQEAFSGVRNNSERFKERVLSERRSNQSDLLSLGELKEKAETIFSNDIERIGTLPSFKIEKLVELSEKEILQKVIIGSQDVDLSGLINRLGNSDWVKHGLYYHSKDPSICPFCQQPTSEDFASKLSEFFDSTYDQELSAVGSLVEQYRDEVSKSLLVLDNIAKAQCPFLDKKVFDAEVQALSDRLKHNIDLIEGKSSEPSRKVVLESVLTLGNKIQEQISIANSAIDSHNQMVANITQEKRDLIQQVWRYVLSELEDDLRQYDQDSERLQRAIQGMECSKREKEQQQLDISSQIRECEKKSTSILPTKDSINHLLERFGFTSFFIDVVDNKGHYKICRNNGDDASRSLSEGEKTFITFLYFYSLIKGAQSSTGTTLSRIVVLDDPISSLDSDILYIVSSLIKQVFEEVRKEEGYIKQVFVMTHNVYFHKEISFNGKRCQNRAMSDESFWIVRKLSQGSSVERCTENPIRSAYELLWDDVKAENTSSLTLQNNLRRILENYFTMWGGMGKDEICELFDGRDKLICQSLFSWVNDGSHSIHDDLYINHGEQTNTAFLRVFREVFEKARQLGHYNMMMGLPHPQGGFAE